MWWGYSWSVMLLALTAGSLTLAQQRPRQQTQPGAGEQQIRLEDIERDNLASSQKTTQQPSSQQQPQQQHPAQQQATQQPLNQQQLAAFQQHLLLQQLQQQYFAPTPIAYGNIGGVPLMIIPSNHLGPGGPLQAYFVPADPGYFPPYQSAVYPASPIPYHSQRVPVASAPVPVQRLQPAPQELSYNPVHIQPSIQTYRQPQNYPSASVVYPGSLPQPQAYQTQQQQSQQQLYNAYNALYQQRQEKNTFGAGVKSTPAPPLKSQNQIYSAQQSVSPSFANYKNFNYNQ